MMNIHDYYNHERMSLNWKKLSSVGYKTQLEKAVWGGFLTYSSVGGQFTVSDGLVVCWTLFFAQQLFAGKQEDEAVTAAGFEPSEW